MKDFIEETFSDVYYPGSKRKRKAPVPKKVRETPTWDKYPQMRTLPNGKDIEMFTIQALCIALGRPYITVRSWITQGKIPMSPYALPPKPDKNGVMRPGRRLYTRAMIEAAIELFDKFGFLDSTKVDWQNNGALTTKLTETWETIRKSEQE